MGMGMGVGMRMNHCIISWKSKRDDFFYNTPTVETVESPTMGTPEVTKCWYNSRSTLINE